METSYLLEFILGEENPSMPLTFGLLTLETRSPGSSYPETSSIDSP